MNEQVEVTASKLKLESCAEEIGTIVGILANTLHSLFLKYEHSEFRLTCHYTAYHNVAVISIYEELVCHRGK